MATRPYYNQQPQTLMDLLAMQANAPQSPTAPPAASQASSIDTGGLLTAQQRNSLLDQLMNPQQTTAEPADEQPQWGKKIAGTFADAFNNIATIYAGGANLRSNYLNEYMNNIERKNAERKSKAERKSEQDAAQRDRKISYILGVDDRAQGRTDRLQATADRELARTEAAAFQKAQLDQAKVLELGRQENDRAKLAADMLQAKEANDVRMKLGQLEAGIRETNKRGDADKEQEKDYKDIRRGLMENIGQMEADLASGATTPDQIVRMFQNKLVGESMSGIYRDTLETLFHDQVGPILMKYAPQQGAEGPPSQSKGTIGGALRGIGSTLRNSW